MPQCKVGRMCSTRHERGTKKKSESRRDLNTGPTLNCSVALTTELVGDLSGATCERLARFVVTLSPASSRNVHRNDFRSRIFLLDNFGNKSAIV